MPPSLKIITWNYDTQLEKGFFGFCENPDNVVNQITFNSKQIIRVNGYCGTHPPGNVGNAFWTTCCLRDEYSPWSAGISLFNEYTRKPTEPLADICFAWEDITQTRLAKALEIIGEVKDIIVIGYSFPYFNRSIDRTIVRQLFVKLKASVLPHIYLQYPDEKTFVSVRDRLSSIIPDIYQGKIQYTHVSETDMFFIPDGLI